MKFINYKVKDNSTKISSLFFLKIEVIILNICKFVDLSIYLNIMYEIIEILHAINVLFEFVGSRFASRSLVNVFPENRSWRQNFKTWELSCEANLKFK